PLFPAGVTDSAFAREEKARGSGYLAQFAGGNAVCSEQTHHPRNHHTRLVRGVARWCHCVAPDVCRSDSTRGRDRSRLDARDAGDRCVCHCPRRRLLAADQACRCDFALVCHWFWTRYYSLWLVASVLVLARDALFHRRL